MTKTTFISTFPARARFPSLKNCPAAAAGEGPNPDPPLFKIETIKVPLAHPEQAKIVNSPRIFTDSQTGALNGLWKGGKHGEGTQTPSVTNMCHEIKGDFSV